MDIIFDMDGTLYSPVDKVWQQMVDEFVRYFGVRGIRADWSEDEQRRLKTKWQTKQTLVAYLNEFDLDFDEIVQATHLPLVDDLPITPRVGIETIQSLPGKKWVLTNSPESFAHAILRKLELDHVFNGVFGIRHDMRVSKPSLESYLRVPVDDTRVIIIDDWHDNLLVPFQLGWKTIWFPEDHAPRPRDKPNYVHHEIRSLHELSQLVS